MKKAITTVVTIVLLAVFGFSAFKIVSYFVSSKQSADRAEELQNIVASAQTTQATTAPTETAAAEETTAPTETTAATEPTMIAGYEEIYNQNQDTVGWIKIENTKVNYPVMQSPDDDEDYYLDHSFDKVSSAYGAIYCRPDSDVDEPSDNITLYGHMMKDGSMFAALSAYTEQSTWENNPLIFFDTLYEYHTYKIFAVFKTSGNDGVGFAYHKFIDAENEQDFNDFIATCKSLAFYDTGITPQYGDKIICLSTCEYTLNNGRLVVCAVRIT